MYKSIGTQLGVTLLELMVTIVIIGILVTVAFPSYQSQITKTRRASAAGCLMEYAQFMERVYTTNMTYEKNNNVNVVLPDSNCKKDLEGLYSFSLPTKTATTFIVTATPINAQSGDTCGALTLNQLGVRTAGGKSDATTIRACW